MSSIYDVKSTLTQTTLDAFCQKYHIPDIVHPELPGPNQNIRNSPTERWGNLFGKGFRGGYLVTPAVKGGGDYLLQMSTNPLIVDFCGLVPAVTFACISCDFVGQKALMLIVKASGPKVPWHTKKTLAIDPSPTATKFSAEACGFLATHPAPFRKFSEPFLCLVGLSRYYDLDDNVYPTFLTSTGEVNTSLTDSQMHNNIMAAGSKDRPPMLGPGRYSQWRSRFLRYIDTKPNGEGLRKSILFGPYIPSTVLVQAVAATEGNPAIQQHTTIETVLNMTPENKEHFLSEKEAILLLLTGIGDDIYSTVDACKTANEMWIAIERLQHGKSLNVQDVKTNLFWKFGKFTSRDGESMESYYSGFYKLMNELTRNNLQVTTMQVNVQFIQQLQPEWSRFVTVKLLIKPKRSRSNATSSSTRPSASTRHKGKEIAKPITPQSELVSEEDSDPEQAQRDKDMQKNLALLHTHPPKRLIQKALHLPTDNLRTSFKTPGTKTEDTTPRFTNNKSVSAVWESKTMNN
ncbi:hypothetical protein Tco_0006829 [Tanacetum coccineum]